MERSTIFHGKIHELNDQRVLFFGTMVLSQPPRPGFWEPDWFPSCCRCCDIDNDHRRWRTWRNMGKMCRELENHAIFMGKTWKIIIRKSSISSKNGFHMLNKPGFLSDWYILDQNLHSQVGVPTVHLVARMLSFRRKVGCGWNAQICGSRLTWKMFDVWCVSFWCLGRILIQRTSRHYSGES